MWAGLSIELLGVLEECESSPEDGRSQVDPIGQSLQVAAETRTLLFDLGEAPANLRRGLAALGNEVQEVVFLDVEAGDPRLNLFLQEFRGVLLIAKCLIQNVVDPLGEGRLKADRLVVGQDGVLDLISVGVRRIAEMVRLLTSAEEVEVLSTVSDCPLHEHPVLATFSVAASAPQRTLEVVVMDAVALAALSLGVENLLDTLEQLRRDEGFVASGVLNAFERDIAQVVPISEDHGELGLGYGTRGIATGAAA